MNINAIMRPTLESQVNNRNLHSLILDVYSPNEAQPL